LLDCRPSDTPMIPMSNFLRVGGSHWKTRRSIDVWWADWIIWLSLDLTFHLQLV
jgi:hypothetical protein